MRADRQQLQAVCSEFCGSACRVGPEFCSESTAVPDGFLKVLRFRSRRSLGFMELMDLENRRGLRAEP